MREKERDRLIIPQICGKVSRNGGLYSAEYYPSQVKDRQRTRGVNRAADTAGKGNGRDHPCRRPCRTAAKTGAECQAMLRMGITFVACEDSAEAAMRSLSCPAVVYVMRISPS